MPEPVAEQVSALFIGRPMRQDRLKWQEREKTQNGEPWDFGATEEKQNQRHQSQTEKKVGGKLVDKEKRFVLEDAIRELVRWLADPPLGSEG